MTNNIKYTVCTQCFTYNQASYIRDALEGFVTQQTDFPVVYTIVDDASTDGEPQVLQNYLKENFDVHDSTVSYQEEKDYGTVLYAQHKINKNCFFAILLLKENHYSQKKSKIPYLESWADNAKYIAMCEGDDYWTNPIKLQIQVDFMDEHKEYSLCCHRYSIFNQNSGSWDEDYAHDIFDKHPDGFSFTRSDNLKTWITKTMTLLYRRELIVQSELSQYKHRCDEHLNYHLLSRGPGYCFPFVGAVYRKCDTGVFSSLSEEKRNSRFYMIRTELLNSNLTDKDLREMLFRRITNHLNSCIYCKDMYRAIYVCLKSYYYTDGLTASFRFIRKLMCSYVKGLIIAQ